MRVATALERRWEENSQRYDNPVLVCYVQGNLLSIMCLFDVVSEMYSLDLVLSVPWIAARRQTDQVNN